MPELVLVKRDYRVQLLGEHLFRRDDNCMCLRTICDGEGKENHDEGLSFAWSKLQQCPLRAMMK